MSSKNQKSKSTQPLGSEQIRWDLHELFQSITDPKIDQILTETQKRAAKFRKKYQDKLANLSPKELKDAFIKLENISAQLAKLSQYINLVYTIDTSDEAAKTLLDKIDTIESEIANQTVFFHLELAKLPTKTMTKFQKSKDLIDYHYMLKMIQKTARHNLSEKEEKVINLKNLAGPVAMKKLYEELTNGFEFEFNLDGKLTKMNGSELRNLRYHEDPQIRREAMKLFFSRYESNETVMTGVFNAILKDYGIEKALRHYPTPISRMNVANDLDDKMIDILHQTTTDAYHLVHRYYKLKSKIIHLPELTLADIYAPIPQGKTRYQFDQAKQIVLESFREFDEDFYQMANRLFEHHHIDAPVLPKKRGGAFCSSSVPGLDPYIMLNFLGKDRDIATMSHEIGHGIHAMLSAKQNFFNFHSILPLCETASVFSEMITTDMLLKRTTDKTEQIAILSSKLEDIIATSFRQNMFSRFEQASHAVIAERRMASQDFCDLYQSELKLMFGDSVTIPPEYHWEWSAIPHMVEVPFYVYAYNFGNLLVMALYQSYLENGKSFIPGFKQFLSLGSAQSPKTITETVGVDITSPAFWQKSIDYIASLITKLEKIIES